MRVPNPAPQTDLGLLVLRVGLAGLLLLHGIAKVKGGIAWMAGPLGAAGLPSALAYGVYVAEIVAPALLILGLFTRLAALVIAFNMAMAVFLVRRDAIGTISPQGGGWAVELEALFFVAALTLALTGAGRYAIGAPGGNTNRFGSRRR
jgi:putative oxidoreductase